jgi:PilZ domain
MTYFPQPNPANRARRVKVGGSVVVAIRSDGAQPVRAKLHDLSATGGLLLLSKPLEQGDFVEVAFQTSKGIVQGMAELLAARRQSTSGCLQPFRFVALGDEDHTRLRMVLEAHSDRIAVGGASKAHSL